MLLLWLTVTLHGQYRKKFFHKKKKKLSHFSTLIIWNALTELTLPMNSVLCVHYEVYVDFLYTFMADKKKVKTDACHDMLAYSGINNNCHGI